MDDFAADRYPGDHSLLTPKHVVNFRINLAIAKRIRNYHLKSESWMIEKKLIAAHINILPSLNEIIADYAGSRYGHLLYNLNGRIWDLGLRDARSQSGNSLKESFKRMIKSFGYNLLSGIPKNKMDAIDIIFDRISNMRDQIDVVTLIDMLYEVILLWGIDDPRI